MPLVGEVGEAKLLELLQPFLATATRRTSLRSKLILGSGDDGAVWQPFAGWAAVVTTDSLVEEVHFHTPADAEAAEDIGWKLLAVSYSDLAAMGARPGPSFVSLSLPPGWPVSLVEALYRGLEECRVSLGGALAGGNISSAPAAVLTSTCVGEVEPELVMRRGGAEPGWLLAVTGALGGAAAALRVAHAGEVTEAPEGADAARLRAWQRRLRRPMPRLHVAALAAGAGVRTAIDVSDGLFVDAGRLLGAHGEAATDDPAAVATDDATAVATRASGLVIDAGAIPVAEGISETWPDEWLDIAGGGEDYELLLAAPPAEMDAAVAALADSTAPARVIGSFDHGDGVRLLQDGVERAAPDVGYEHFG